MDIGSISACNGGGSVNKDFIVGEQTSSGTFGAATLSNIPLGSTNTNSVNVIGSITPSTPPTGSVTFLVCGPEDPSLGCSSTNLNLVSTWNVPAATLTAVTNPNTGQLTSTAKATSNSFTPTKAGAYCFAVSYAGDANYLPSADNSSDECFTVSAPIQATITSPVSGTCYGTSTSKTCPTFTTWPASPEITGTSSGPNVAQVTVTIQDSKGKYWDDTKQSFSSATPIALKATDTSGNGTWSTWSYSFPVTNFPPGNSDTGSYTIAATATDNGTPPITGQSQPLNFQWGG
jgi:hypothetical protein